MIIKSENQLPVIESRWKLLFRRIFCTETNILIILTYWWTFVTVFNLIPCFRMCVYLLAYLFKLWQRCFCLVGFFFFVVLFKFYLLVCLLFWFANIKFLIFVAQIYELIDTHKFYLFLWSILVIWQWHITYWIHFALYQLTFCTWDHIKFWWYQSIIW